MRIIRQVWGLTELDGELFVLTECSEDIEVYNVASYDFEREITIPNLKCGHDITACQTLKRIYVGDSKSKTLHAFDRDGRSVLSLKLDGRPAGVSVTPETNILVTFVSDRKFVEFSAAGKIVREISLQADISHPFHAVQISHELYAVSHGNKYDLLNRVVIVGLNGRIQEKYGGRSGAGSRQLDEPASLVFCGFIFVSDYGNGRIYMLSPELRYVREIVSGLNAPNRMWLDEFTGRLFVADNMGWNEEKRSFLYGMIKVYSLV